MIQQQQMMIPKNKVICNMVFKHNFKKLFKKLKSKFKKTIIVLSRDLLDTVDLVDKIYVINSGNLVLSGGEELY